LNRANSLQQEFSSLHANYCRLPIIEEYRLIDLLSELAKLLET